eukprot:445521-Hanusia_phi.AAC.1
MRLVTELPAGPDLITYGNKSTPGTRVESGESGTAIRSDPVHAAPLRRGGHCPEAGIRRAADHRIGSDSGPQWHRGRP